MTILTKTISGLVSDMVAVWSAQTGTSQIFTDGDPLLAFWQSVATQIDFLQAQVQLVLALARAQTSTGADLDSWMAQFGFVRLGATFANGLETFFKFAPSAGPVSVPAGAIVQTLGGTTQYAVVADTGQSTWNAAANAYILAAGQTSLSATVEAVVAGSGSNVTSGALTQFGSSVPGIDAATNPAPIVNGVNAETDAAFRARFILFLATLAKATYSAILAAATSVQQGMLISLLENIQPGGTALPGSFTVVADDGSGNPPAALLTAVFNAVNAVRAFSVQPFVIPPGTLTANVVLAIRLAPTVLIAATVNNAVQLAIANLINALPPGGTLYASAIISTALAINGVVAVNPASVTINGSSADLVPTAAQEIRAVTAAIAVSNY